MASRAYMERRREVNRARGRKGASARFAKLAAAREDRTLRLCGAFVLVGPMFGGDLKGEILSSDTPGDVIIRCEGMAGVPITPRGVLRFLSRRIDAAMRRARRVGEKIMEDEK